MQGVPQRRVAGLHKQGTTQQRARKTKDKYANYSFTVPKRVHDRSASPVLVTLLRTLGKLKQASLAVYSE
jgi:hypothetical protein